jgi:hypothetical protein|tara:strand:- start:365 stop:667 length:303 start_codon:yes stop_codon:yes gene_type:complete
MKKLLLVLLFVPLISFGQTKEELQLCLAMQSSNFMSDSEAADFQFHLVPFPIQTFVAPSPRRQSILKENQPNNSKLSKKDFFEILIIIGLILIIFLFLKK